MNKKQAEAEVWAVISAMVEWNKWEVHDAAMKPLEGKRVTRSSIADAGRLKAALDRIREDLKAKAATAPSVIEKEKKNGN